MFDTTVSRYVSATQTGDALNRQYRDAVRIGAASTELASIAARLDTANDTRKTLALALADTLADAHLGGEDSDVRYALTSAGEAALCGDVTRATTPTSVINRKAVPLSTYRISIDAVFDSDIDTHLDIADAIAAAVGEHATVLLTAVICEAKSPDTGFDVEDAARHVLAQVREMQASGEVSPELYRFGNLHDQMDVNDVDWGCGAIEAIPPDDWIAVTERVTFLLCADLRLCTGSSCRSHIGKCRHCGHNVASGPSGYADAHTPDGQPALTTEPLAEGDRVTYRGDRRRTGRIVEVITNDGNGYEYDEPRYKVRYDNTSLHDDEGTEAFVGLRRRRELWRSR